MPRRNSSAGGEHPLSVQTMKMSACWMLMILAGCRLSCATQSTCTCNNNLTTVCVPAGHNVSVPCPYLAGKIVKYNLLLGPEMIYNITCWRVNNGTECKQPHNRTGVEMYDDARNEAFFMLTGVTARSHGVYRCHAIVELPPPYKIELNHVRTLVLVEGYQCNINCAPTEPGDTNCGFLWIYIIIPCVAMYGLVMTIITCFACAKVRRIDSQSDYMNTKPKPSRDRRKRKGVQNPIPRHF